MARRGRRGCGGTRLRSATDPDQVPPSAWRGLSRWSQAASHGVAMAGTLRRSGTAGCMLMAILVATDGVAAQ